MSTDRELAREFAARLIKAKSRQERQKILDEIKSLLHDMDKKTYAIGFVLLLLGVLRTFLRIGIAPLSDNAGLLGLVSSLLLAIAKEKEENGKGEEGRVGQGKVIKDKTKKAKK